MGDDAASVSWASHRSSEWGQLSLHLQPLSEPQKTCNQASHPVYLWFLPSHWIPQRSKLQTIYRLRGTGFFLLWGLARGTVTSLFFFDWVPCGAHLPSPNSSLSHLLSLCSVCFFPLCCFSVWFAALSSPTTDWIPAPGGESVASWPLNWQGIPCFLFSQSTPLSLLSSPITDFCENLFGIAKFSQKFSGALFYLGLKPCFLCMT